MGAISPSGCPLCGRPVRYKRGARLRGSERGDIVRTRKRPCTERRSADAPWRTLQIQRLRAALVRARGGALHPCAGTIGPGTSRSGPSRPRLSRPARFAPRWARRPFQDRHSCTSEGAHLPPTFPGFPGSTPRGKPEKRRFEPAHPHEESTVGRWGCLARVGSPFPTGRTRSGRLFKASRGAVENSGWDGSNSTVRFSPGNLGSQRHKDNTIKSLITPSHRGANQRNSAKTPSSNPPMHRFSAACGRHHDRGSHGRRN